VITRNWCPVKHPSRRGRRAGRGIFRGRRVDKDVIYNHSASTSSFRETFLVERDCGVAKGDVEWGCCAIGVCVVGGSVPWAHAMEKKFRFTQGPGLNGCERGKNRVRLRYFGSYCVKSCAV